MEVIGSSEIWSYCDEEDKLRAVKNTDVRKAKGHTVTSYMDLARKVAALQFRNRENVLLFRGQASDHRNSQRNSTLKPTLLRPPPRSTGDPDRYLLAQRFGMLGNTEAELVRLYEQQDFDGKRQLRRQRILRWSILQHYEICPTPLLDVTHSLRVAASFASLGDQDEAFVYVLGVPTISGSVTASAESGIQIVRLASVCPPQAVRPHIQEGYLLGEYPEMPDFDQKQHYDAYEVDFGRRLVAKFKFHPSTFWGDEAFPAISKAALYPDNHDPLFDLTSALRARNG